MSELTDAAYLHVVSPQLLCGLTSFKIKPEMYGCVEKIRHDSDRMFFWVFFFRRLTSDAAALSMGFLFGLV